MGILTVTPSQLGRLRNTITTVENLSGNTLGQRRPRRQWPAGGGLSRVQVKVLAIQEEIPGTDNIYYSGLLVDNTKDEEDWEEIENIIDDSYTGLAGTLQLDEIVFAFKTTNSDGDTIYSAQGTPLVNVELGNANESFEFDINKYLFEDGTDAFTGATTFKGKILGFDNENQLTVLAGKTSVGIRKGDFIILQEGITR